MDKGLELRMYFFVMYNISPIQKGIQAGHAALEYANKFGNTDLYKEFISKYKTWIILDGGSSNNIGTSNYSYEEYIGSMELILDLLNENKIDYECFYEPDLNNATSAICFIADERVWNKKDYPNLYYYYQNNFDVNKYGDCGDYISPKIYPQNAEEVIKEFYIEFYNEWVKSIGGEKILFLRQLLNNKKLA